MKDDFVYREMCECGADGVDFVPIGFKPKEFSQIYESWTKQEWAQRESIPKTNRAYWKLDGRGNKVYI